MTLPVSVTVSFWGQLLYIVGLLFFSFCAFMSYTFAPSASYFFSFFVILCLLGLSFGIGTLSADDDKISVKKPWAAYQIYWSDIQIIELSSHAEDGLLVFSGKDKRLRFAAPALWKWKQKGDFLLFVNQKIEEQQIKTKTNWKAVFHFNKNVRVSRNG